VTNTHLFVPHHILFSTQDEQLYDELNLTHGAGGSLTATPDTSSPNSSNTTPSATPLSSSPPTRYAHSAFLLLRGFIAAAPLVQCLTPLHLDDTVPDSQLRLPLRWPALCHQGACDQVKLASRTRERKVRSPLHFDIGPRLDADSCSPYTGEEDGEEEDGEEVREESASTEVKQETPAAKPERQETAPASAPVAAAPAPTKTGPSHLPMPIPTSSLPIPTPGKAILLFIPPSLSLRACVQGSFGNGC
jgi:hypothetical protein